ncbi:LuxR family transcriptional regulator [Actinomyces radicidentis]|uniref:LuxR family transcriptional regulator n=2 Tax=Actinomyces radicidentis TaxID=111015 RepID=A0A0X8JG84_ACTRD|nr:response regulator transcription factor [Actinomyces radicidentis]AMD87823.1 LuxR family transcriptional regulator [Actinomyces radicidentis]
MSATIRVALTDDEPLLTAGLSMLLGAQEDVDVVWEAPDGPTALARCASDPVDVLLLDVQMPGMDGIEVTRRLVASGATCRVVILTTFDTDGYVLGAIEAGAAGFLLKSTPPAELLAAVRAVSAGDSVISPGPTRRLLSAVRTGAGAGAGTGARPAGSHTASRPAAPPAELTERELEVLRLVALGLTNQELCDRLWLSMPTVKTHVSHLLAKTGARDRVQLVLEALRSGVVTMDEVLAEAAR